jgi:bifunctional non-homologous end joining protein LigD
MASTPRRTRAELPDFIEPQLTLAVEKPPEGDAWAHELKFDGYRIHARVAGKNIKLLTRTGLDWTHRYETIARAFARLNIEGAYLDGELCALRPDGTSSFAELQAAGDRKDSARLTYFAFDLLFLDGEDLRKLPLEERKRRLKVILEGSPAQIRYTDHVVGNGGRVYALACSNRAEGIVSKRLGSPYKSGDRGLWRKIRCVNEEEFVVVGFTNPQGGRQHLGALLLGYYAEDGRLIYAGRAGTGMDTAELKRLAAKLKPLEMDTMPVDVAPPRTSRFGTPLKLSEVHWVQPKLVAQVRYLSWTTDGLLRQVVYLGLREDKPARQVVRKPPA